MTVGTILPCREEGARVAGLQLCRPDSPMCLPTMTLGACLSPDAQAFLQECWDELVQPPSPSYQGSSQGGAPL